MVYYTLSHLSLSNLQLHRSSRSYLTSGFMKICILIHKVSPSRKYFFLHLLPGLHSDFWSNATFLPYDRYRSKLHPHLNLTESSTIPAVSLSDCHKTYANWRTDSYLSIMRLLKVIGKLKFLRSTQIKITSIYCLRLHHRHSCPNWSITAKM